MAEPTASEILAWALINRARLDPTGEAVRYGIDLNEGPVKDFNGNVVTITTTSKQPLAWNSALHAVADQHSADMLASQQMYHNSVAVHQTNLNNAGYSFSWWGENIARQPLNGGTSSDAIHLQHRMLFIDPPQYSPERGHRLNIMNENFQEVGVGEAVGTFAGSTNSITTQDFGKASANTQFLTGITYNDTDGDQFYDVGEARGGVTVTTSLGNVISGTAGAFSKAIAAGVQTISFSGAGLPATISANITVLAGRNALVDLVGTSGLETSVSLTALSGVIKIVGLGNIGLTLVGNSLDNTIVSALGNDSINGGDGVDTAAYSGARAAYTVTNNNNGTWTVTGREGTDTLSSIEKIQFSDQTLTTGVVIPANTAPVATVSDKSLSTNQAANIASWVSYSDANGDAAVQYQIVDNGTAANSAALIDPGGVVVAAGTALTVTAAQLASVAVRGGGVAGSDTMQIRAFDGKEWGAWDNFTVTTTAPVVINTAPVAAISDKSLLTNQTASIASWVSYSDANGDAAVQYQILDNGTAANSAALIDPGGVVVAAGTALTVTAAQLASVAVRGGGVAGSDTMQIRAFDGKDWGAWDNFTVTTTAPVVANRAPVATINDKSVKINEWAQIKNLLAYTDADGNPAVRYEFWDGQAKTTSGYFWTPDNAHHDAGVAFSVEAAELANVWVRGGTAAGSESMFVRAFDGTSWSAWDTFKVTTLINAAPIVAIADKSLKTNQWVKISDIITFSDQDGDAAVKYEFVDRYDNAGGTSGYLWTPDNAHHAANEVFSVNAADIANVWVRGGQSGMWENMQVRVFDGIAWSAWDNFKVTTIANAAPVATMPDLIVSKNEWLQASDFLTKSDANGDAITQFQFVDLYDGSGSGYFYTPDNVKHAANEVFTVSAADLDDVYIRGGSGAGWENMQVRAFDGESWGAWDSFKFTTLNNNAPVVGGGNVNLAANQKIAATALFSTTDADFGIGDRIMQYQFFDDTAGGGSFTFKNAAQAADKTFTVNAADLGRVGFSAAAGSASDLLWARAFDGDSWSEWHSLYANTL